MPWYFAPWIDYVAWSVIALGVVGMVAGLVLQIKKDTRGERRPPTC